MWVHECLAYAERASKSISWMYVNGDRWYKSHSGMSDALSALWTDYTRSLFAYNKFERIPDGRTSAGKSYRFRITSAMRIYFNWQIIRRPIKDAKSGGDARDTTGERIQLCKLSFKRTAPQLLSCWPLWNYIERRFSFYTNALVTKLL